MGFDLEKFRASSPQNMGDDFSAAEKRKSENFGWYFGGRIPGEWLSRAARLPGKSLHVALALWHGKKVRKSSTVKLGKKARERFSIGRDAIRRGLLALEGAGLVSVKRRPGQLAEVEILDARADDGSDSAIEAASRLESSPAS